MREERGRWPRRGNDGGQPGFGLLFDYSYQRGASLAQLALALEAMAKQIPFLPAAHIHGGKRMEISVDASRWICWRCQDSGRWRELARAVLLARLWLELHGLPVPRCAR